MQSDLAPAPLSLLEPQHGFYWEPIVTFSQAAFRPAPRSTQRVVQFLASLAGSVTGTLLLVWPAAVAVSVLAIVLALMLVAPLRGRWAWRWEATIIADAKRRRDEVGRILGDAPTQRSGAAWLARSPDAPVDDRYRVLGFIGHDELAEQLIPELPTGTPEERFWQAWAEVGRDWRLTGRMETDRAMRLAADLDPKRRRTAEVAIDFGRGMAAVWEGRHLRDLPRPVAAPLPPGTRLILAVSRFRLALVAVLAFAFVALVGWVATGGTCNSRQER